MVAATRLIIYFEVFTMKQHAVIEKTPKGTLKRQISLRIAEYCHLLPLAAAAIISGVIPVIPVTLAR